MQQLLLLPATIRRDLSCCLSPVEVVHFEEAGLFHDIDTAGVVGLCARQILFTVIFDTDWEYDGLKDLFTPNVLSFLVPDKCSPLPWPTSNLVLKHISESYPSLPCTTQSHDLSSNHILYFNPIRTDAIESLPLDYIFRHIRSIALFLQNCNVLPPKRFSVNLHQILKSCMFECYQSKCADPFILFLQVFLSQVQAIQLWSNVSNLGDKYGDEDRITTVSHILLYSILTSRQPCLEQIRVYGECREIIDAILFSVKQLCCDCCSNFEANYPLRLDTTPPALHLLKSLSITHNDTSVVPEHREPKNNFGFDRRCAASISSMTHAIIFYQLHSLEHVAINLGTDFCYGQQLESSVIAERSYSIPEHRELLSALAELMKQPQLQSLSVGRAPLTEAYQLVEVFLCTETTHSLSLTIEGVEEEHTWTKIDDNWMLNKLSDESSKESKKSNEKDAPATTRPPPAQPLPDSNGALKSLNIGCSCDRLLTWLFNIPNLRLKELSTSCSQRCNFYGDRYFS